ncbi:MAG: formate--tetrahydrofolate ligase [Prevotellaceae bacterium]|jgi:formate--tetrahydrofolate ligase|nr:formate--tetrahydrofolate ligase [Prevotellaceae bacterium]
MLLDIEIAQKTDIQFIENIAQQLGISPDFIENYGKYKAKLPLDLIDDAKIAHSNLILVTAISPTPAGEGKTTVSIGLAQAINKTGSKATVVLREPSLGPVFGIKGGAAGGGYSQVIPMDDINLHFTGDFAAVEKANNLLSALIDNNIQNKKNRLGIDPATVLWKRVIDMNDRSLRCIITGLGGASQGTPRETGFNITAASEVMAILCLSSDIADLKKRLGNIFVGYTFDKKAVYARDLKAEGAMATLLKEAIKPNLVQTIEGTPAIIHGGPFANIAQGTNSVIATKMGMSLSEYVVTEAGFGSDLGAEKFLDIKCRLSGLSPKAVVIVVTLRALRYHGGVRVAEASNANPEALKAGIVNLEKHIENIKAFGISPVVAINKFVTDTQEEIRFVTDFCNNLGVKAEVSEAWSRGGDGALSLAKTVIDTARKCKGTFTPLYPLDLSVEKKIETIAASMYGAKRVEYSAKARNDLKRIYDLGFDKLPVCIAKTQKSLSDNPLLIGRPKDFTFNISEIEIASGAGFIIPIAGGTMRMPGLPEEPAAEHINIDNNGMVSGLF